MTLPLYVALARRHAPERFAPSRRELLKSALIAGTTLLAGSCGTTRKRTSAPPRVVIVGAGFAGLACASELCSAGFRVTLVESRARVGGRVLSLRDVVADKNVEGGGELIGSNHPLWMTYSERFDLPLLDVPIETGVEAPIVLEGRRLSRLESDALWEEMDSIAQQLNDLARDVDANEPWQQKNAVQLDRQSLHAWIESRDADALVKRGLHAGFAANNGVETREQSLLAQLAQVKGGGVEHYWTDSEVYRCKGGNQRLAHALAATIGPARIHLSTPVESIWISDDAARVACAGGATFEADHVVLAIPPSTWSRIRFEPALPQDLRPQMGITVKLIAAVKRRYWVDAQMSQYALSDGEVAATWDPTSGQLEGTEAAITAFSSARAASACRSRNGVARREAYARELERLLPGFTAELHTARFMDWPGDPHTGAGYSFPAPGQVTTAIPRLRAGIGRLHFAGEHTSTKFVGYMEGGLDSGVAVARKLATVCNAI